MWTLKMKFWHEGSAVIPFAQKYKLTILTFPLNRFAKGGKIFLTSAHIVLGEKKSVVAYLKEISGNPRYLNLEFEGNLVVYTIVAKKGASHLQMYLDPELIFVKPIIVKPDGFEYLEVAALNKKVLTRFLKTAQRWVKIDVQSISNEKIRDFYIPHFLPDLTEKQKKAILLAYKNGYYDFPKRTEIQRLAKLAGLSPSAFQEHLRRAEQKLIPFTLENIAHEG
ncbi:MAG: helix-turn-helix domain-containing protein [Candidatus Diapherotrites archaeon]|nr:helix-turn-helix domain-containing protein [Candidatus Diapherotrites archaeon]